MKRKSKQAKKKPAGPDHKSLPSNISSKGKTFSKRDSGGDTTSYEYRGSVGRDEEGDEFVESKTWEATEALAEMLKKKGFEVEHNYDEKGWVGVHASNKK